jgi:hypothetical protein
MSSVCFAMPRGFGWRVSAALRPAGGSGHTGSPRSRTPRARWPSTSSWRRGGRLRAPHDHCQVLHNPCHAHSALPVRSKIPECANSGVCCSMGDAEIQTFDNVSTMLSLLTQHGIRQGFLLAASSPARAVHVARQGPEQGACCAGHSRDERHVAGRPHPAAALAAERGLLVRRRLPCCAGRSLCLSSLTGRDRLVTSICNFNVAAAVPGKLL